MTPVRCWGIVSQQCRTAASLRTLSSAAWQNCARHWRSPCPAARRDSKPGARGAPSTRKHQLLVFLPLTPLPPSSAAFIPSRAATLWSSQHKRASCACSIPRSTRSLKQSRRTHSYHTEPYLLPGRCAPKRHPHITLNTRADLAPRTFGPHIQRTAAGLFAQITTRKRHTIVLNREQISATA